MTDDLSDVTPANVRRRLREVESDLKVVDADVELAEDASIGEVARRLAVLEVEIELALGR